MEKNRVCTICNRRFANGKALGGHMRSHFAKLPLPPKQPHVQSEPTLLPALSSSSLHRDRKNATSKDFHLSPEIHHPHDGSANSESSFIASTDPALHDKGSEAEPQRNPKRRRSSRRCKPAMNEAMAETSEQVSSVSETFSADEDVARCLLMLLRDSWTRKGKEVLREVVDESAEDDEKDNEDDGDGDYESFSATQENHRHRPKYRCETCNKVFRSHQAYGGHKASQSHKRMKLLDGREKEGGNGGAKTKTLTGQRLFKCPFCDKVFDSGQGLGGHKKVHFFNSEVGKSNKSKNGNIAEIKVGEYRIDLNLSPSPEELEGSHEPVESSAVSSQKKKRWNHFPSFFF